MRTHEADAALVLRALSRGLETLSPAEKNQLIADPAALSSLHWAVWTSPQRHASWRAMIERAPARVRSTAEPLPGRPRDIRDASVATTDAATGD